MLTFTGSGALRYKQDLGSVHLGRVVLNTETNGVRCETEFEVIRAPLNGVIKRNTTMKEVTRFYQCEIDDQNGMGILYEPKDTVLTHTDSFELKIINRNQSSSVLVNVTIESALAIPEIGALPVSESNLTLLLPLRVFGLENYRDVLENINIKVISQPLFGTITKLVKTSKRSTNEFVTFSGNDLARGNIVYLLDPSYQKSTAQSITERFDVVVTLKYGGQPGLLTVTFRISVPAVPHSPTTQKPTGSFTNTDSNVDFSVYMLIPILGAALIVLVVVSIVCGSLVVRYYRLKQRELKRRQLKKGTKMRLRESGDGSNLSPKGNDESSHESDSSSEGSITNGDIQEKEVSQSNSPPRGQHTNSVMSVTEMQSVSASSWQNKREPVPVPLPTRPHETFQQPFDVPLKVFPQSSTEYMVKAKNMKTNLKYNASKVDPSMKKLFRSDYPELKHVEYWV